MECRCSLKLAPLLSAVRFPYLRLPGAVGLIDLGDSVEAPWMLCKLFAQLGLCVSIHVHFESRCDWGLLARVCRAIITVTIS